MQLAEQMLRYGWETRFVFEEGIKYPNNNPMDEYNHIIGWNAATDVTATIRQAIDNNDEEYLHKLKVDEVLGICIVYADTYDRFIYMTEDEYDELVNEAGNDVAEKLHTVQTSYSIQMGRVDAFSIRLWHAIGVITNGVMADLNTGEYYLDSSSVTNSWLSTNEFNR